MFERFTDRARRVVVYAQEEALLLGHNYIGTEHILLGLLREGGGVAAGVMTSAGLSLEAARTEVERMAGRGESAPTGHVPFTPRAKKTLELSLREALEQQKSYIGTEHILLALLREGEGVAAQILLRFTGSESAFRQRIVAAAGAAKVLDEAGDDAGDVPGVRAVADPDPRAPRQPATVTGWPPGWPPPLETWGRSVRIQATAVRELRETLKSIHLRLAYIDRRLAAIEGHLGIEAEPPQSDEPPGEPDEPPGEPDGPPGEPDGPPEESEGPSAAAE